MTEKHRDETVKRLHLYQFSDGNPQNTLYLISTVTDEQRLRNWHELFDHGSMPYEDFVRVWTSGKMVELTENDLDSLPDEDLNIIPYCTDERIIENDYPKDEYPFLATVEWFV